MIFPSRKVLLMVIGSMALSACGGGGGSDPTPVVIEPTTPVTDGNGNNDGSAGISGSGQRSIGVITRFGSIFVNGVEYETDQADIFIDGQPATEDDLAVGMVVSVVGEINADGTTGIASIVIVDDEILGPINAIATTADGDSKQLTILGVDVIVERTATVFDNTTFETLAVDDVVEVSGFPETGNNLRATRVEKKSVFVDGETDVEIKGTVANLTAESFTVGDYTVDYTGADLTEISGELADGMYVEIYGVLTGQTISATRVETEDRLQDQVVEGEGVEVEGTITNYVDTSNFTVNGVSVDASSAQLKPTSLALKNGLVVEVEGSWDGSLLVASSVELRRGRIEIEAPVASIDTAAGTLELTTGTSTVLVVVTTNTLFDDDDQSDDRLSLADLNVGDFVEVEAYEDGDQLVATRIDRDNDEEISEIEIQGIVTAFTPNVDITILGTAYDVSGAVFEGAQDEALTLEEFFQFLTVGALVKIEIGNDASATAIKVEFEDAENLDGSSDFDDDSDESDDDDEDSDDADEEDSDESDEDSEDSDDDDDEDEDDEEDDPAAG